MGPMMSLGRLTNHLTGRGALGRVPYPLFIQYAEIAYSFYFYISAYTNQHNVVASFSMAFATMSMAMVVERRRW